MKWTRSNPILYGATVSVILLGNTSLVSCFAPPNKNGVTRMVASPRKTAYSLGATKDIEDDNMFGGEAQTVMTRRSIVASMGAAAALTFGMSTPVAFADEYGRETEAAFLSTGETVMICTKRGPLGKCEKTELRTLDNDNDKSEKYFRQPTEVVKRKDNEARMAESTEGNALIERLKKQSEENSEKNELLVYQRTLMNDSSASFGPFDGQVLILNEDGKGFTLLANPQAMRLKKAGFIEGKKFVKQPTEEEIEAALEPEPSGPGLLDRFFGSS